MNTTTEESALIPVERAAALQAFSDPSGLDPILAEARHIVHGFEHDMSTAAGRKRTASLAFKVRRLKTKLDDLGKELTAEWAAKKKAVDDNRREMRSALDALADEARKPLDEFEAQEEARVRSLKIMVDVIRSKRESITPDLPSGLLRQGIENLQAMVIDDAYQEFEAEAHREKDTSLRALRAALERREKYEAEQAELARLRAEAEERERREAAERAEREQREREERAAQAAAEAAKREAAEAQARVEAERQAAIQREQEAQERAKQEEQRRIEAEARAKIEAEQAAERARQEEIARQRQVEADAAAEQARRDADIEHRKAFNREAHAGLMAAGLTHDGALSVITAIINGKVPHVSIRY